MGATLYRGGRVLPFDGSLGAAEALPGGSWVMGTPVGEPHYFLRRSWRDLAEGQLPDRHVLDRASDRHPILTQAWACPGDTLAETRVLRTVVAGRVVHDDGSL